MVEALRAAGVPARVVGTASWNQEAVELNEKAV
jgi:transglutaminase-like putative cysteine protease